MSRSHVVRRIGRGVRGPEQQELSVVMVTARLVAQIGTNASTVVGLGDIYMIGYDAAKEMPHSPPIRCGFSPFLSNKYPSMPHHFPNEFLTFQYGVPSVHFP